MGKLANINERLKTLKRRQEGIAITDAEAMKSIERFMAKRNKTDISRKNEMSLQRVEALLSQSGNKAFMALRP